MKDGIPYFALFIGAAIGFAGGTMTCEYAHTCPSSQITTFVPQTLSLSAQNVTAYCSKSCCCGRWADGVTASGHIIQPGDKFVAAKSLPFGTMITIPGYGTVPVRDRGPDFDVFFDDHQTALEWGRQKLDVIIRLGDEL